MDVDLTVLRQWVRPLLNLSAPRDGLAVYYALYHDPARTRLLVEPEAGLTDGFLAVCQTGRDLFRMLVVLRARAPETAAALLRRGLLPGRPYYLLTTPELREPVEAALEVERSDVHRIYRLDLRRYMPIVNVLVTPAQAADGSPRFVIRSAEGEVAAESGFNWRSPHFAEVYVHTDAQARQRGWGRAAANACVTWIVRSGSQPLYRAAEGNVPSIHLATSLGFVDTGARELAVEGVGRGA